ASGGAEQLREAIDRAVGGIEFFCFEVWGKARANTDARTRALEDAARLIVKIESQLKRDLVIDTLGKALDIDAGIVRAAVARAAGHRPQDPHRPSPASAHPNAPGPQAGPSEDPRTASTPPDHEV